MRVGVCRAVCRARSRARTRERACNETTNERSGTGERKCARLRAAELRDPSSSELVGRIATADTRRLTYSCVTLRGHTHTRSLYGYASVRPSVRSSISYFFPSVRCHAFFFLFLFLFNGNRFLSWRNWVSNRIRESDFYSPLTVKVTVMLFSACSAVTDRRKFEEQMKDEIRSNYIWNLEDKHEIVSCFFFFKNSSRNYSNNLRHREEHSLKILRSLNGSLKEILKFQKEIELKFRFVGKILVTRRAYDSD